MIQLIHWAVCPFKHREHWPTEYVYYAFGFGRPFCIRGTMRFGIDDFGSVDHAGL